MDNAVSSSSSSSPESAPAPASRASLTLTLLDAISGDGTTTTPLPLVFEKRSPLPPDLVKPVWVDEEPTRPMHVRRLRTEVPNPDPVDTGLHDLPPNLTINLGECIGHGRSGLIFKVQVEPVAPIAPVEPSSPSGSSGISTPSTTALPALVAKIGRQHFNKWLLREAWFYEEMQSLQGLVIPRCYGLYSALIPHPSNHASSFLPWPWLEGWRPRNSTGSPSLPTSSSNLRETRGEGQGGRKGGRGRGGYVGLFWGF